MAHRELVEAAKSGRSKYVRLVFFVFLLHCSKSSPFFAFFFSFLTGHSLPASLASGADAVARISQRASSAFAKPTRANSWPSLPMVSEVVKGAYRGYIEMPSATGGSCVQIQKYFVHLQVNRRLCTLFSCVVFRLLGNPCRRDVKPRGHLIFRCTCAVLPRADAQGFKGVF